MVSSTFAAFAAMSVAFTAVDLFPAAAASAPDAGAVVQVFFLSALFFTAVASVYLRHVKALAAVGAAGDDKSRRRLAELVTFVLCGAAGVLELLIFARPPGAVLDGALPAAAATVTTFFLGVTLLIVVVAHIRAGGEGGGGGGDDPRRVPAAYVVDVLKKVALGAAAAVLVGQVVAAALFVK